MEDQGSAEISLYNSAAQTEAMNVATMIADTKAVDISGKAVISDKALTSNTEEIKVLPEIKESVLLTETAPTTGAGASVYRVIADTNLKLSPNQGNWKRLTRLAYRNWSLEACGLNEGILNPKGLSVSDLLYNYDEMYKDDYDSANDFMAVSSAGALSLEVYDGRRWRICAAGSADPYGFSRTVKNGIPNLYQNYKTIVGSAWMSLSNSGNKAKFMLGSDENIITKATPEKSTIDYVLHPDRIWTLAALEAEGMVSKPFVESLSERLSNNIENYKFDRPTLALLDNSGVNNTTFDTTLDYLFLERAVMKKLKYEVVCKDGDVYLGGSGVLDKIKPTISISNGNGGTDASGYIFVGSELVFGDNPNAGSFKISKVELKKNENGTWITIDMRGNNTLGIYSVELQ